MAKRFSRSLQGFLLFNKPIGPSSNQALQTIKYLFAADKAGHTGSLDPLASGMLPICFGGATRYAQYLLNANKSYRAKIRLGQKTSTADAEGRVIEEKPLPLLSEKEVSEVLTTFLGTQFQCPPMYSAIKHQGKPLYELARKGIEIEREKREIEILGLRLLDYSIETLTVEVDCSKGTYIRTLAEDIGEKLGCGGHIQTLHRLSVEGFQKESMQSIQELQKTEAERGLTGLDEFILPIGQALKHYPEFIASDFCLMALRHGKKLRYSELKSGIHRVQTAGGEFKGLVAVDTQGYLKVERLIGM